MKWEVLLNVPEMAQSIASALHLPAFYSVTAASGMRYMQKQTDRVQVK